MYSTLLWFSLRLTATAEEAFKPRTLPSSLTHLALYLNYLATKSTVSLKTPAPTQSEHKSHNSEACLERSKFPRFLHQLLLIFPHSRFWLANLHSAPSSTRSLYRDHLTLVYQQPRHWQLSCTRVIHPHDLSLYCQAGSPLRHPLSQRCLQESGTPSSVREQGDKKQLYLEAWENHKQHTCSYSSLIKFVPLTTFPPPLSTQSCLSLWTNSLHLLPETDYKNRPYTW